MASKKLASVTNELITSYGNTAKNVIQAYRMGNARITRFVDQRWATAIDKVGTQLSSEVRSNALAAELKVSTYYTKGISLGTDSADMAISKVVALAGRGVTHVSANANRFEKATGVTALNSLAAAALPAAVAVSGVVSKIEAKSDQLVRSIAGTKPRAKRAAGKRVSKRSAATTAAKAPVAKLAKVVKEVKAVKAAKLVKEASAAVATA